ncbi:unnamed protein product [Cercospora beticola]|nr:unnamed protein product [Cercospora beticola]
MSTSLSSTLPLAQWVENWNQLVFFQPDDNLSSQTLSETVDPNFTVKINHTTHDINGLKAGVQWVRSSFSTTLNSNEELIHWIAPDGIGGAVVHKTVFTSKEVASGKTTKKTSLVTTIVKNVDGKRVLAELVEVEVEEEE